MRPSLTGCGKERKSQVWGRDQVTISFFLNYSLPGWCWDWSSFVSFLGLLPIALETALSSFRLTALGTSADLKSAPLPREGGSEAQLHREAGKV